MIPTSFSIVRIKGIEIRLHFSWVLIYLLVVWSLRIEYFENYSQSIGSNALWLLSVITALGFFSCLLLHELSHSLVARRNGIPIHRITMFIFGGVAHLTSQPKSPTGEVRMTIAGPLASFAIAGILFLMRIAFSKYSGLALDLVTYYLMIANVAVGIFNLLPGFPLDGGRLLRAALWRLTKDFFKATRIASAMGRIIGLALVFVGVVMATAAEEIGFLWLCFIGIFLERLAVLSARREIERYSATTLQLPPIAPYWQKEEKPCIDSWFSISSDGHLLDQEGGGTDSSEEPEV